MSDQQVTVQPSSVEFRQKAGYGHRVVLVNYELGEARISFYTESLTRQGMVRAPLSLNAAEIGRYFTKADRIQRKDYNDDAEEGAGY